MSWSHALLGAAAVVLLAAPSRVAAQQEVESYVCESRDNSYVQCPYNSTGTVTVHVKRQISSAPCTFDLSWGTYDGGVWVDRGCRAEFSVRRPPQTPTYRPVGGTAKTVTCESRDSRRKTCDLPNADESSIYMERKLSSAACVEGSSWGKTDRGIWVDRGCRATFAYVTRGGGAYKPYGGTDYDHQVNCESRNGEWKHCEVRHMEAARIELLSANGACQEYKAWGQDDTGVWVRSNCAATFQVRYRH